MPVGDGFWIARGILDFDGGKLSVPVTAAGWQRRAETLEPGALLATVCFRRIADSEAPEDEEEQDAKQKGCRYADKNLS